jgi:flagellar protein FlaG
MSGKVVLPSAVTEPLGGVGAPAVQAEVQPASPVEPALSTDQADLRLIIEESSEAGHYVYVVVDQRTGKVISRLPREEVLRLRDQSGYSAGAVFNGKV